MEYKDVIAKHIANLPKGSTLNDVITKANASIDLFKFYNIYESLNTSKNICFSYSMSYSRNYNSKLIDYLKNNIKDGKLLNKSEHVIKEPLLGRYLVDANYIESGGGLIRESLIACRKAKIDADYIHLEYYNPTVYIEHIFIRDGVRTANKIMVREDKLSEYKGFNNIITLSK